MELSEEETVQSLRIAMSVEVEHNKTLVEEKGMLEKALNDEKKRQAELGERVALLEQELKRKSGKRRRKSCVQLSAH